MAGIAGSSRGVGPHPDAANGGKSAWHSRGAKGGASGASAAPSSSRKGGTGGKGGKGKGTCYKCGKEGHWVMMCPGGKKG